MLVVTGGVVSIEDARKHPGYDDPQYAPARKVRVELTFTVAEDGNEQEYLDRVAALAEAKVQELLGGKPAEKKAAPAPRGRPKPVEVVLPPEPAVEPAKPVTTGVDMSEFDAELPVVQVAPVTDKELHDKIRQRADALGGSVPVRKLIGTFAPPGAASFQVIQIPQERRHEFLAKLAALTA